MAKPSSIAGLSRHQEKAKGMEKIGPWMEGPEGESPKPNAKKEPQEPQKRLNVDVPERLHKALKRKALDDDTNVRALVVGALEELLKE